MPSSSQRLQKVLAQAGIASRRRCEDLIRAGRVTVNGEVVTEMGIIVDASLDSIAVDGIPIPAAEEKVYLMLHKPAGYLTTVQDERGRPTVMDLIRGLPQRLFPVGRLDKDSEGLLLLTNDGPLALRLTHPSHRVAKEYLALVQGHPGEAVLLCLRRGVAIDGRVVVPDLVERLLPAPLPEVPNATWLRLVVHEGSKRLVRRLCLAVGFPVLRLIRVREGPLSLGNLPMGKWRRLSAEEVKRLKQL